MDDLLDVAHYLDRLAPNLNALEVHDGPEQNAEQWKFIWKSMKILQTVRTCN